MTKLSTVSIFLCMTVLIAACRKIDTPSTAMADNATAERFLKLPITSSPEIKRIGQKLELLNQKHGFLSTIGKQDGLPVWDKPIFNIPKNAARSQAKQASTASNDTIVYIPLVLENANFVNAFIYAKLNGTVHLQLHRGKEYADYGFGNIQDSTDNAERLALQIMVLDKEVFGHTKFRLLDRRLFAIQSDTANNSTTAPQRFLTIEDNSTNTNTNASARSSAHWEEGSITHCTYTGVSYHRTHTGSCAGGTCDNCPLCVTPGSWNCVTTVQYYFVSDDDDWGGGSGGGSGGGGGAGGGSPEGPQPCNPTPELENGLPPCPRGGGDGWIPELDDFSQTPCEIAQNSAKKMDTLFNASKADSVLNTIPNLATETNEKGFPIYVNFAVNPYNVHDTTFSNNSGDVQTGTDTSITISSTTTNLKKLAAILHTHPPKGYAAQSAFDIYSLIEETMQNNYYQGAFVAAANGDKYAITITDPTKANAFFNTKAQSLNGTKWNEDSEIGKAYKKAFLHFEAKYEGNPNSTNLAYEMAMAAVLKQYDAGVTLSKKDTNGNFKPIVVNTTVIPRQGLFKPEKTVYTQDCL